MPKKTDPTVKNMPKKTNLTANNLIYRPGWFPPIPDTESKASEYHGVQEFYKNQQNKEYFHKVLKENFGFDLEADPEDVKKRMIITSKVGKFAMEDYLKSMEDISLMPDSPEKMNKYHQAAGALEGVLYQQLAKGRLIFIPLGETEPRQFRYNPNVGEFQLSGPLKSLDQYRKVDEEFLPRDKKNNIIYQKKEKLLKPENPGEFKGIPPQKPQPIGPFREYLRDMPVMGALKPLREEPVAPKDPQEGGKTKQELIDDEFKRISSDVVKPEHRELKSPIPRFVLKAPVKYEKPEPPRDDLMKPVIPSVEKEIEKVDDQLKSLKEPVFPSEFKRVLLRKPDPVAEPYKPVLENPDPPDEPEYKAVPNEPIFKHPLEPKISIELPKFKPREEPVLPKSPVLTDYPEKQAIRPEPVEPERPGFFRRFFSSASVRQWEARHSEWETDHNAWLNESSQANLDFSIRCAEVDRENNEKLQNYAAEVRTYVTEYELYKKEVEEYRKQVQDLEGTNEELYDRFKQDKKYYEKVRKELGDQYDVDYQEFLEEHKKWEKTNQEIIKENERLKKEYENSPVYKKYVEDQKWYDTNMSAFAFDYKNLPTLKKQYMDEYENKLAKYKTYLQEEKAYQDAIKPVKEEIEADDKAKNGNNPDYEQNKEARINERLAANEKANLDYDKELKDYKEKLENLYDVRQTLIKSDKHVQYVVAQKAYERNEELRTRKVIVKKQAPVQSDFDYNIDYDQLDEEGKIRLGEKLDPIINSDEQFLPSEKRFEENSKAVSEKEEEKKNEKEDEKEKGAVEGDNEEISIDHDDNDALNYTFVEDEMMDSLKEGDIDSQENQANAEEKKNSALKEDEEEISLYEYEVRRFEAYEKDQKYYDLMKKRYDEKKAEYDREKLENDKWNDSLEEKLMEYDQHISKLHEVAENNVSQRIEGYKNQKRRYDEDHSKWVEEEKDYKEKKNKLETEYVLDNHKWKKEKEEYDKKKAEYDEKLNEYGDDVKYYNRKVQEYNAEYKDYVEKKRKYEQDVKMNEIIEARNREYEQEYNKIAAAYEKKVMDKNPELKDYKMSQLEYVNGTFQWGMELKNDGTVPEWKNSMNSDQALDNYFVEHQRKINNFNSYKIKCKNIKKVDPIQQQNYEAMIADKEKYGKYPEESRVFFKMLDMEDEKLNNAIAEEKNINFEFFKVAATVKMYNKIVRDELESNYRETNFDPRKMLQFMDKKYRHEALMDMREDEILTKSLKKMYDENVKMSKKIDRNVQGALNDLLNDDWKLANCYRERYVNSKKKVVDPIKRQVYGPKTEVKKGIGGKK